MAAPLDISSEEFLKKSGVTFYLSDLIRDLVATVPVATVGDGQGANSAGDAPRSSTPLTSSNSVPGGAPLSLSSSVTIPGSVATPSSTGSGVFSPTTANAPAGSSVAGGGSGVGSSSSTNNSTSAAGASGSAAGSSSAASNASLLTFNFDDVLSEMSLYFQDVFLGSHLAGSGCPIEYVWCTHRNRLTLALASTRSLTQLMPAVLSALLPERSVVTASFNVGGGRLGLLDSASMVLEAAQRAATQPSPPTKSAEEYGYDALDLVVVWHALTQLHCADFPRTMLDSILRVAARFHDPKVRTWAAASGAANGIIAEALPLRTHAVIERSFLLHCVCKELWEDLQVAFPTTSGGGTAEKCRGDLWTWRRAFDRWGLDGNWRCGPNRASATTAAYAVEPYPPLSVLQNIFSPVSLQPSLLLDADAIACLIIQSDVWYLWCLQNNLGVVASAIL